MAPHSSTLAWKIPWTEEHGRLHAVHGVAKHQAWLSDFTFTFHFPALEKEMAAHSSVPAWRIPGTAEPGGLPSMGSHRVRHDWSPLAAAAASTSAHLIWSYPRPSPSSPGFPRGSCPAVSLASPYWRCGPPALLCDSAAGDPSPTQTPVWQQSRGPAPRCWAGEQTHITHPHRLSHCPPESFADLSLPAPHRKCLPNMPFLTQNTLILC